MSKQTYVHHVVYGNYHIFFQKITLCLLLTKQSDGLASYKKYLLSTLIVSKTRTMGTEESGQTSEGNDVTIELDQSNKQKIYRFLGWRNKKTLSSFTEL